MSDYEEMLYVFAAGMLPKTQWLRDKKGSDRQSSAVRESLTQEIRKLCDALVPDLLRPAVSRRAAAAASALNVDLCLQTWKSQKQTFDVNRNVFHLEHVVPVSAIRDSVIAVEGVQEVVSILHGLKVAWILKDEDAELRRLGYRFRRTDPVAAYAEAGIELITCHP